MTTMIQEKAQTLLQKHEAFLRHVRPEINSGNCDDRTREMAHQSVMIVIYCYRVLLTH